MKQLPNDARDDAILDAVREWVALLAEERYADAWAFLSHDSPNGQFWTAEEIASSIRHCGRTSPFPDGQTFRVTPLATASGGPPPRHKVHRYETDEFIEPREMPFGFVWFDLPLNGEWSELTAELDLVNDGQTIVFELIQLDVF